MKTNKYLTNLLKLIKGLLIIVIISLLLCLLLEQISRCYLFGQDCFNYKKMSTLSSLGVAGLTRPSAYPDIMFEYKPDLHTYNKLAQFKTNSQGLRDRKYTEKKPQNTFRVVVLGGSYSAASGVDNEENYHSILEKRLNQESSDTSYEFINFSVSGYHLNQKIAALKYKVLKYEPDLILLALGSSVFRVREKIGNIEFQKYKRMPRPRQNTFFQSFALKLLKTNRILNYRGNQSMEKSVYSGRDIIRYDSIFNELKEISKTYNIPICIAVVEHDYAHLETNKQTMSLISKYGFYAVSTIHAFENKDFSDYIIYNLDKHPNADAHKIFAEVIYKYLSEQSLLKKSEGL